MANKYYSNYPVESAIEASILSDQYTWTVIDVLRKAGSTGLTAIEVHRRVQKKMNTSVSASKIYGLLKQLYEQGIVHRYYDREAEAQRHTLAMVWGGSVIEESFYDKVVEKEGSYIKKNLNPVFMDYVKKVMKDLAEDPVDNKWLPSGTSEGLCKRCRTSHEAEEFYSCVIDIALKEFINSDEFEKFMRENGFDKSEDED